jgi:hypothetical protein
MKRFIVLLCAAIYLPLAILAQVNAGSIQGVITDASGASVPTASIHVRNLATGVALPLSSNDTGFYLAAGLVPGRYEIEVQASGFKPVRLNEIVVQVGDQLRQDFSLEVGQVAQSLEVTATAPLLQTTNASLGAVVDTRKILDMPMISRDVRNLARLAPGVSGWGMDYIGGGIAGGWGFYVDGVAADSARAKWPVGRPSVEAVAEFKVETNNLSAEYGRITGGAINIVTRGGGNDFHGSLYEFFWNNKMNANSWRNNFYGFERQGFRRNMFGGNFNGPVVLPKYNGRNRTFFFFSYDGSRTSNDAVMRTATVPSDLELRGDFSQSLRQGRAVRIFDPNAFNSATGVRAPFAGNRIPQSRFSPLALALLELYPRANRTPDPGTLQNNYQAPSQRKDYGNDLTFRVDQTVTDNHRLFFRFTQNDFGNRNNPWMGPATSEDNQFQDNFNNTLSYNGNVTPTWMLTANAGLAREWIRYGRSARESGFDLASLPLAPNYKPLLDDSFMPVATLDGMNGIFRTWRAADIVSWKYYGSAAATKIWGRQTLKLGYIWTKYLGNFSDNEGPAGVWSFGTGWTQEDPTKGAGQDGYGLASMLLGTPASYNFRQVVRTANAWANQGAYFQDDIRVTSKLTLNLGLRWDYESPMTERYNRGWFWDETIQTGWSYNQAFNWQKQVVEGGYLPASAPVPDLKSEFTGYAAFPNTAAYPGRGTSKAYRNNFSPRVGAAFQIDAKTVLRGGYGRFFNGFTGRASGAESAGLSRFSSAQGAMITTIDNGRSVFATIDNPFPNDQGLRPALNDPAQVTRAVAGDYVGPLYTWHKIPPRDESFNFSIQRELPARTVVEVSYAGNRGHYLESNTTQLTVLPAQHLSLGNNLNKLIPNPFVGSNLPTGPYTQASFLQRRPTIAYQELLKSNPQAGSSANLNKNNNGDSWYNAMYVRVEKRLTHGLSFQGAYTLSKLIANIRVAPQDGITINEARTIADSDYPHKFTMSWLYELPSLAGSNRFLRGAAGGWRVAGIYQYLSGPPLSITQSNNLTGVGMGKQRPTLVGTYRKVENVYDAVGLAGRTAALFINKDAFAVTPGFTFGNAPPYLGNMRGPSRQQWDLSLMKAFRLTEKFRLQFRVEAENAFNQVSFSDPDTNIQSAGFGTILNTRSGPRQLQIGARIDF